ncbi:pyocin activator PrtN family protein [Pseudomonas entomophila]|uniref:pyocin activator PrtN family protein n=1 Tax=Pseudomonas entomophila TaxID=312306 RepID=UPI001F007247|nr:pyocin activator PrtN family protein [Pseudomonas entomophila]MCG8294281.1 pyocin activator PrtN family protein [Pseudomonas entomophila]
MTTLEQLRSEWATPYLTLSEVRERYFPHIGSDRRFRELINKGAITLKMSKLHNSTKAQNVFYLYNIAQYFDQQAEQPSQTA